MAYLPYGAVILRKKAVCLECNHHRFYPRWRPFSCLPDLVAEWSEHISWSPFQPVLIFLGMCLCSSEEYSVKYFVPWSDISLVCIEWWWCSYIKPGSAVLCSAWTGFCPSLEYFVLTKRIFQHQSLIARRFQELLTELQYCPHVPFQILYVPLPTFAFQSSCT